MSYKIYFISFWLVARLAFADLLNIEDTKKLEDMQCATDISFNSLLKNIEASPKLDEVYGLVSVCRLGQHLFIVNDNQDMIYAKDHYMIAYVNQSNTEAGFYDPKDTAPIPNPLYPSSSGIIGLLNSTRAPNFYYINTATDMTHHNKSISKKPSYRKGVGGELGIDLGIYSNVELSIIGKKAFSQKLGKTLQYTYQVDTQLGLIPLINIIPEPDSQIFHLILANFNNHFYYTKGSCLYKDKKWQAIKETTPYQFPFLELTSDTYLQKQCDTLEHPSEKIINYINALKEVEPLLAIGL